MKNEIYISKEERVAVTLAGDSQKFGPCERTGREGTIVHYRGETLTKHGSWNEVFSMFVSPDYALDHLDEYTQKWWMIENGKLLPA